jgi:hypothetical protein
VANYVKATNFAAKDALVTTDPAKIIKGTEIDNEYNAIASAVSSKADSNSPTLTGTPLAPTAAPGTNTTQIATTAFVAASTGSATNIAGGGANRVVFQSALDTTSFAVAPTVAGTYLGWTGSAFAWSTVSASTSAALTVNNSGSGASSGATFNGSLPVTISYNTVGAPSTSGTGATGTWGINITGSSGSTSFATTAGSASTATTASSVTNGVYVNATNSFTGTNNYSTASSINMSGSSTGDQRLQVSGSGVSSGISPGGVQIGASGTGIVRGSGGRLEILVAGYGVNAFFQADGNNLQGNNSPSWASVSDQNIKTNLRPISSVLEKINALKPCHFEYKDKIGETRTGFIAQEFATVFPGHTLKTAVDEKYKEFLPEGVTELMAIDINLTAYLVKAIQELSSKLDAANARIAELENA